MQRILSTYRFANQPLGPSLVAEIAQSGFSAIEIFCTPAHFSYHVDEAVRELGDYLQEYHLQVHSLHAPTERDSSPGRESGVPISISDTERIRRLDAVDEIKRALEIAERIPCRFLVQHIGSGRQIHDQRKLDAAFTSLEHLSVFAKARGVIIALENTPDELGSPSSLQHFIADTHLHDLKLCFDIGHAHMDTGVDVSFEAMRDRVVTAHIHDNHGQKDEHLLPYEGTIDWDAALSLFSAAAEPIPLVLELREQSAGAPTFDQIRTVFDKLEKNMEDRRPRATHP